MLSENFVGLGQDLVSFCHGTHTDIKLCVRSEYKWLFNKRFKIRSCFLEDKVTMAVDNSLENLPIENHWRQLIAVREF